MIRGRHANEIDADTALNDVVDAVAGTLDV